MIPPLVESLNLPMVGVHRMVRTASNLVLGAELAHLRESLGYAGGGSWQAYREETLSGKREPWANFTQSQAGITEAAARYYSECWKEVKLRVGEAGLPGSEELLALMDRVPSELTNQERQLMMYEIIRLGVNEDETQSDLRRAYRRRPVKRKTSMPEMPECRPEKQTAAPDDAGLLASNMESLALGAGLSLEKSRLVSCVLRALRNPEVRKRLRNTYLESDHE